jgi:hypothetical protein
MDGFQEEAAEFSYPIMLDGPGRWRRIAGIGPVYEILEDKGDFVHVKVLHSDEAFDYRKSDAELDPPA